MNKKHSKIEQINIKTHLIYKKLIIIKMINLLMLVKYLHKEINRNKLPVMYLLFKLILDKLKDQDFQLFDYLFNLNRLLYYLNNDFILTFLFKKLININLY